MEELRLKLMNVLLLLDEIDEMSDIESIKSDLSTAKETLLSTIEEVDVLIDHQVHEGQTSLIAGGFC